MPSLSGVIESDVNILDDWIHGSSNKSTPVSKRICYRTKPSAPWYKESLRNGRKHCKLLERQWQKNYNTENKKTYKAALKNYYLEV